VGDVSILVRLKEGKKAAQLLTLLYNRYHYSPIPPPIFCVLCSFLICAVFCIRRPRRCRAVGQLGFCRKSCPPGRPS
jgi:hypothetical protein